MPLAYKKLITLALLACLFIFGCRKDDPAPSTDSDTSSASDDAIAETIVNDLEAVGAEAAENQGSLTNFKMASGSAISLANCATVTIVNKIITVDFGTSCLCNDGRTRSGKLIYDFSASSPSTAIRYRNPGFDMKLTSQNYIVDGYSVTITSKNVKNTTPLTLPSGLNPGTNLTWSINSNISIVKPSNAGTITRITSYTKELLNTSDTNCYRGQNKSIVWTLAKVKFNGNSNGVNAKGENYTNTATDLVRDMNCSPYPNKPKRHPFISGKLNHTPGTKATRYVDYGNGACDLNATVTINGVIYNITLP
jgi:hypothetical protein